MKVTEEFVCEIKKLQYISFENQSKYSKDTEPMLYMCSATVKEIARGSRKNQERHTVVFYLTEEEFETKDNPVGERIIDVGDRINIHAGAKWHSTPFQFKSFKKDVISKMDPSKLKFDAETGKTYYVDYAYTYKIVAKPGCWSMHTKFYEQNYCTIKNSRIKLPMEDKAQFLNTPELDWYLDANETKTIKEFNGQTVSVIAYTNGTKFSEKNMVVDLFFDEENHANHLTLRSV